MAEQEAAVIPPADVPATTTERPVRTATKNITSRGAKRKADKTSEKSSTGTVEEKRLARNAALREWRRKNADHMKAYMTQWRAKRKGEQPIAEPGPTRAAQSAKPTAAPDPTSKAIKKKIAKKPKKGGRR